MRGKLAEKERKIGKGREILSMKEIFLEISQITRFSLLKFAKRSEAIFFSSIRAPAVRSN